MESMSTHLCLRADSSLNKYPAKQHAQQVSQRLGVSSGLIYLLGQQTIWQEDSDEPYPFRQRRYFYYLSGVDERDCSLTYDIGKDRLTLYIPSHDQKFIVYHGVGLTIADAYDKFDVDAVEYTSKASEAVQKWTRHHPKGHVFILHPSQEAFPGQNKLPHVDFTKLQIAIDQCRVIKYPHEIELIRKANDISAEAHRTVLSNIAGLHNEAQVEAIFKEVCIARLAKNQAYDVIAASGENAATLHYGRNNAPLAGRQLMVLDAGCEWELYASDVTRTFPLSGSWPSEEANAIYDLVQSMQNACIERVKPGVRFLDLHHLAHQIAVKGLLQLGILHNGEEADIIEAGTSLAFFPHGLGHHLGLEVHDVSDVPINGLVDGNDKPVEPIHAVLLGGGMCRAPVDTRSGGLEEGMVVTIEPGIYFSRFAIEEVFLKSPIHSKYINKAALDKYYPVGGVRIEDDILVTKTGYENLTTAPKGEEMLALIRQGVGAMPVEPQARVVTPGQSAPNGHSQVNPPLAKQPPIAERDVNAVGGGSPHDIETIPTATYVPQYTVYAASLGRHFAAASPYPNEHTHGQEDTAEALAADPLPAKQDASLFDGFQQALRPGRVTGADNSKVCTTCRKRGERCDGGMLECGTRSRDDFVCEEYWSASADINTFNFQGDSRHLSPPALDPSQEIQCQTCHKRGEMCDGGRPECTKCDEDGYFCEGYWPTPSIGLSLPKGRNEIEHYPQPQAEPIFRLPQLPQKPAAYRLSVPSRADASRNVVLRIAAVTATYVHSVPQNRNKNVTGDEFGQFLETNPSLDGLCRLLQAMDLQVNRHDLETALSEALPGINFSSLGMPL